ncbi:MAG: DUF2029 domain-containing protein [Candidatus Aminicenantes bacterium]|nr:DUF2029 domain-containing protein [Candidatus Aminicenantes bacterium]
MDIPKQTRIVLIVLLLVFFLLVYVFWVRKDMSDFGVCYQGGKRILKGETLYRVSDGHLQYKYSPPSAVFFSLLGLLPYEVAKFIWYLSELVFLYFILILSYKILPTKLKKKGTIIVFSLLILAKFYAREIELGQVNIHIILTLTLMLLAMLSHKYVLAGLCWGLTLFYKPYALVFLPYFLLKKKFRLVATGIVVAIFGLFSPVIFYGFKGNMVVLNEWMASLSRSTSPLLATFDNASLHSFFLNILPGQKTELALVFIICVSLLIGLSFIGMMFLGKREDSKKPEVLEFAFLFILIPLLSPLGWYYNYLYSILAIILLLNCIEKFPAFLKYGLIINFIIIGVSLKEVLGRAVFDFYTQNSLVVINYLIVLFFLFFTRFRKYS